MLPSLLRASAGISLKFLICADKDMPQSDISINITHFFMSFYVTDIKVSSVRRTRAATEYISSINRALRYPTLFIAGRFKCFSDFGFDLVHEVGILCESILHRIASLTEFGVAVGEPRAALFDDARIDSQVDYFAHA